MLAPDGGEVRGGRRWHRGCYLCGAGKAGAQAISSLRDPEGAGARGSLLPPFPSVSSRLLSLFPVSLPTTSVS